MAQAGDCFVDVVLPLALPRLYTYSIPDEMIGRVEQGMRVVVSFGRKKLYAAVVFRVHSDAPNGYQTKDIIQLIDEQPVVLPGQLKFWSWVADYYMCYLGEVMKAALPSGLKMESESFVSQANVEDINFSDSERIILHLLDGKKKRRIQDIATMAGFKNPMGAIKSLLEKNAIFISEEIEEAYRPKTEKYLSISPKYCSNDAINELLNSLGRAPAQQRLLLGMLSLTDNFSELSDVCVPKRKVLEKVDVSAAVVGSLVAKGVICEVEKAVSRVNDADNQLGKPVELSSAQLEALNRVKESFATHHVTLLHGVTSSGKTEVYIHLIGEALAEGKQVLYLLPEIALTTQIISRLRRIFGDRVGVYHSKFSDSQRVEVYNGVLRAESTPGKPAYSVILGVRSSIFLPFRNLGLVIVDEEHENTYKQFNPAPRYQARDAAIMLAGFHGAKVLLGTATPSVETYFNARTGKYGLVELADRYLNMELPQVEVVDVREARKRKLMRSHFSEKLIEEIGLSLERNEQVILFQNRRGFAPFIECHECGWVPHCENCDVTLTYHKASDLLVCHYCGYSVKPTHECMACGSTNLQPQGFGTEKVEDELQIFFPEASIERIDLDSTRSRTAYEGIIARFETGQTDILIGTQMVTKGLDFDRVSLVGVLNADNMLNFPDFRASERSFQLMAQVSGRAGRKNRRGLVIIQTSQPNHPVIKQVKENDYMAFYATVVGERQKFLYPPFCRLISISIKHKDQNVARQASEVMANGLKHSLGNRVLGPEAPMVGKIQGYYIQSILVKAGGQQSLSRVKELIAYMANSLRVNGEYRSLVVAVDVDPQ